MVIVSVLTFFLIIQKRGFKNRKIPSVKNKSSFIFKQYAKRKFKDFYEMKRNASHKMIYDADEESGFDEIPEEVFEGDTR